MNAGLHLPTAATDSEFSKTVTSAREDEPATADIARLATHLAASGTVLNWPHGSVVADIASSGGPGSLSTLFAPWCLRAHGFKIVKLTVKGRPAGSIDTMGILKGYHVHLDDQDVRRSQRDSGFSHMLADSRFAPLDAGLFAYRKKHDAVAIPSLAIASILSKKIAVGATAFGLDIRVRPNGNLGSTIVEAHRNARRMCQAAAVVGIQATGFITPNAALSQPWIGRGEQLVALAHAIGLNRLGGDNAWLDNHVRDCQRMAVELLQTVDTPNEAGLQSNKLSSPREAMELHLAAQGSSLDALAAKVEQVLQTERTPISAPANGALELDIQLLRDALVNAQADQPGQPFRDPAGVQLCVQPGTLVDQGQVVASVRQEHDDPGFLRDVHRSFRIRNKPYGDTNASAKASRLEVVHA